MSGALTKPARWNLQGTLSRAPELWRGIGYAGQVLPFWGDERNYAGEVQVVDTDGTDLQAVGTAGVGAEFTGTETLRYFSGDLQDNIAASVTFAMVWTHDGTSNNGHIFDNRLGTSTGYDIAIGSGAGSNVSANNLGICTDTASAQVTTEINFSSAPAGLTAAVFRYDGATVTLDCLQSDGTRATASQSQTGNATGSLSTNHSQIGNAGNETDPFGAGRIMHLFVISERAWSDAETQAFLLDPFAIIEPAFDFGPVFGDLPATAATITGSGAINLNAVTVSGTAEREVTGSGAITASAVTVSGAAERELTGSGAITVTAVEVSGSAAVGVSGTGAITLGSVTVSGVAERSITGTGAISVSAVTMTGSANKGVKGTGAINLNSVTLSGAAERVITGSGAFTLTAVTVSGVAVTGDIITGRTVYLSASANQSDFSQGPNITADSP